MEKGLLHIYTGDGKGKTTAAAGLAARAAGQGLSVGFFQFLKSGLSGEVVSLAKLGVETFAPQSGPKFVWQMDETEKKACAEKQAATLARAAEMSKGFDLLVLDEVIGALDTDMVEWTALEQLIKERPSKLELVLTGRNAPEKLLEMADYVTEMKAVAHPYSQGVAARRGIEF